MVSEKKNWWSDKGSNFGYWGEKVRCVAGRAMQAEQATDWVMQGTTFAFFGADTSNIEHTEGLFSDFVANVWFLIVSWGGTDSSIQLCWGGAGE